MSKHPLPEGVYEHLVTRDLAHALAQADGGLRQARRPLDPADAHHVLARHIASEVARVLAEVPNDQRPSAQLAIVNRLVEEVRALLPESRQDFEGARVESPGEQLLGLFRGTAPVRPATPLASSTLLTRNRAEPTLGSEINCEVASADRIDVLVAFITLGGVRALRDALEAFCTRGAGSTASPARLRILTTVFSGTTEVAAVEALARLPGSEIKISYDVRRTRLHAKAWLFHRDSGLHTAYIGSANLTSTALGSGHEWMLKVCSADLPHVIEKFQGTFEALWNDPEFERFERDSPDCQKRLRDALHAETRSAEGVRRFFTLRPFPFQEEILDRLATERLLHGRRRNLVVAATGTGKTVIAAFDYRRYSESAGIRPRLLFVAHRRELLEQALDTFRHVLQDGAFGELLVGGLEPARWDHVFATIQSVARGDLTTRFGAEYFRYVVIDECHHAPADTYRALIPSLQPDILLGLTATPERSDGKSLLPDFDGHVAAEVRIWHALERQLLVPFEYYGISDNTDLRRVRWSRTGYDQAELAGVYTGNEARVDLVVAQLLRRVAELKQVRAIAFCVSVEHAEFMARAFERRGMPALAVHGATSEEVRRDAPRRLREREVNVLCTCDLYNEGVDLPFVDTLLLLRPTASATLFLQQLGRGLRLDHGKASCLVLDFIGRHRTEFQFDGMLTALSGVPRSRLVKTVEQGFPYLPSGCVLQLDAVARDHILASLRANLGRRARLTEEVRELSKETSPLTLARYLDLTGRELDAVYGEKGGWASLQEEAGVRTSLEPEARDLSRRLGWLLHVDDRARLDSWMRLGQAQGAASEREERVYAMLAFQLQNRGVVMTAEALARYVTQHDAVSAELRELGEVLDERIVLPYDLYPVPEWPIALHKHYSRREILAAIGYVKPGDKGKLPQGGILKLEEAQREILLVTLDKSDRSFSPTTRYRDYAISPSLFHWETQSLASVSRPSGRRYLDSAENGWTFHLFIRTDPEAAYAYAGPAKYVRHEGDRPIAITWQLEHPLPAVLYQQYATLAQG